MKNLLEIAISQLGIKEVSGSGSDQTIVSYAKSAGFEWVNNDETPWSSIFINWCAKEAGLKRSNKLMARSWLTVGITVDYPEPGDLVIFSRGKTDSWQGYVGLFMGYDEEGERIYTLGANPGNQVSITAYPKSKLLGFRRLTIDKEYEVPNATLRLGNTGEAVKNLQYCLRLVGFNPGTTDGVYGNRTVETIRNFQASGKLEINGVYCINTAAYLKDILKG
ncbi:MAG TPA: TIGR02594 family protein [Marinilabiliaceae bacterium]|nr:TIGR02594 family protein [Marinilabiliaceae bacterium]